MFFYNFIFNMTIYNLIIYFINLLIKYLLKITRKRIAHDNIVILLKKFIVYG